MVPRLAALLLLVAATALQVVLAEHHEKLPFHDLRGFVDLAAVERFYQTAPIIVDIPMRDGVKLSTVIVLPNDTPNATFPAVIDRSVYSHIGTELLAMVFVPHGFAAVMQDMRGAGMSEGLFSFWRSEGSDTFDTLAWIEQQSWSNGNVYQIGFSADGMATLAGGINEQPPQLKGQWVSWASATGHNSTFQGGVWVEGLLEKWLTATGFAYTIDEVKAEEQYSDWWSPIDFTDDKLGQCHWPSVQWAGWYDIFQQGNLDAYKAYQDESSGCGGQHTIFIDPHGHCGFYDAGEVTFPNSRLVTPVLQSINLFLSLEGKPPAYAVNADTVTFYVMGPDGTTLANYWTTLPDFPAFVPSKFYLSTPGLLLQDVPPQNTGRESFVYDPTNPQPTLGGHLLFGSCGQYDQTHFEERSDVLVFTSAVLEEPLAVTGRINASIWVSTTANDTDVLVKLIDVYPDGRSMFIADGIRRLRWRYDRSQPPVATQPNAIYEAVIDVWSTSYIFEAGHRVKIHVSSSSFDRYSVNYNSNYDEIDKENGPKVVATNTIYFSPQYPSYISLPIVQLDQLPNNFDNQIAHGPAGTMPPELAPFEKFFFH